MRCVAHQVAHTPRLGRAIVGEHFRTVIPRAPNQATARSKKPMVVKGVRRGALRRRRVGWRRRCRRAPLPNRHRALAGGTDPQRPFARPGEPPEFLHVDVDELTGMTPAKPVGGSGGPSFHRRFNPRRCNTAQTVETAISSVAAILVLLHRNRRNRSIWASSLAGVRVGHVFGADDRSVIGSPASWRANHR